MEIDRSSITPQSTQEKSIFLEHREIGGLNIIVPGDYEQMSQCCADMIFSDISDRPDLLLCAATGSTPTRTYDLLTAMYEKNPETFDELRIVKLDEWGGIPGNDPATCETYLQKHLIKPLSIDSDRFFSFESNPNNPDQEIQRIAQKIKQEGGIDLCILGMGVNGHLGFNEPATVLTPHAHIAVLSDTTKKHTMAQQTEGKIEYGLTLGMDDIMDSKKVILLINGVHKQEAFQKFMSTNSSPLFPVSKLWQHPNVTIICDKELVPDITRL